MSSLLAWAGPSVLDRAGAVLTEACEQRLWAQSETEVVDRVEAALRVRAQADAVLLAAVGEVEARDLARSRGASSTRAWLHGAHQLDPAEASMLVRTGKGGFWRWSQQTCSASLVVGCLLVVGRGMSCIASAVGAGGAGCLASACPVGLLTACWRAEDHAAT